MWSAALAPSIEVVNAACDAVVAGLGDMPLAMLAGLCAAEADKGVRELLPAALIDIGLQPVAPGTREAEIAALRILARCVLHGRLTPRELTMWVHRTLGHEFGEPLASLDDQYDMEEDANLTLAEIDAAVIAEATRLASEG